MLLKVAETARMMGRSVACKGDLPTPAAGIEPERSLDDGAPAASAARRKRVVVVDDSAAVRHELRHVLSAAEFGVIEAPDGEQALSNPMLSSPRFEWSC